MKIYNIWNNENLPDFHLKNINGQKRKIFTTKLSRLNENGKIEFIFKIRFIFKMDFFVFGFDSFGRKCRKQNN